MHEEVYHKLAKVLDTLPNGFPATESGIEIRLLKKIFTPEQADLFCKPSEADCGGGGGNFSEFK